jgi:hypothetical protein
MKRQLSVGRGSCEGRRVRPCNRSTGMKDGASDFRRSSIPTFATVPREMSRNVRLPSEKGATREKRDEESRVESASAGGALARGKKKKEEKSGRIRSERSLPPPSLRANYVPSVVRALDRCLRLLSLDIRQRAAAEAWMICRRSRSLLANMHLGHALCARLLHYRRCSRTR